MKKNEESLKVLWDINKWISIHIMEVPEREKGQKAYFKKKCLKTSHIWGGK